MTTLAIVVLLFVLMLCGIPLAFALLTAGVAGLYTVGGASMVLGILKTTPLSAANTYELLTIPMFMLMAEFVILSGIADNLFRAATVWVGRFPGGLGVATAMAGAAFGAISGSSTASAATLSATTLPSMLRAGYPPHIASGAVAISGTLAMLIPPSVAIVLYGLIANQNIGELLIAGILPGLLVAFTIAATVVIVVLASGTKPTTQRYSIRDKFAALKVVGPMVALFLMVTGVIYLGVATPTEAASLGAAGAMLLAWRAGKLTWQGLRHALTRAANTTCMIMLIIMCASVFAYFFTLTGLTQDLVAWIGALGISRWLVLLLILAIYIVLGCFLDQISVLILTIPITLPVVMALGFNPIWFGILVIVTAELGMVTPPVGLNVFVVARYSGMPAAQVFIGIWPHILAHIVAIAILLIWPEIILWLPTTMGN
ncbi:MAG: TRAP transporter large permease [Betaproteobacteria bacterium]